MVLAENTSNGAFPSGLCAVDTETTGVEWFDKPFLASIARRMGDEIHSATFDLTEPKGITEFAEELRGNHLVFHNAKFDLQKLILVGALERGAVSPDRIGDTECLSHLLDEHRPKRLKALAADILGLETDEAEAVKAARKEHGLTAADGYDKLPRELIIPYALKDAEFTLLLYEHFWPSLSKHPELLSLYAQEMELTLALLDMEWQGMAVDVDYLGTTAKEYAGKILELEIEIRELTQVEDPKFPNSPKQIKEWFADHGTELQGTGKEHLSTLDHPLAEAILALRKLRKIEGTYLRGLLEIERDGIVHPGIRQHGTVTGRSSSGGYEGD